VLLVGFLDQVRLELAGHDGPPWLLAGQPCPPAGSFSIAEMRPFAQRLTTASSAAVGSSPVPAWRRQASRLNDTAHGKISASALYAGLHFVDMVVADLDGLLDVSGSALVSAAQAHQASAMALLPAIMA
jgi:hypothetical protein